LIDSPVDGVAGNTSGQFDRRQSGFDAADTDRGGLNQSRRGAECERQERCPGTRGRAHVRVAADPDSSNSGPKRPSSAADADVATFNHMAAKSRLHRQVDLKARRRGRPSALTLANVENGPLTSPQIIRRATLTLL
jgi:hypothetical protein